MKSILQVAVACLLLSALCGCHKEEPAVPFVSSELAGCSGSLREIVGAKKGWARDTHASSNATPAWEDLKPYLPHGPPRCPAKGTYTIGALDELPTCSIPAHNQYFLSLQQPKQ